VQHEFYRDIIVRHECFITAMRHEKYNTLHIARCFRLSCKRREVLQMKDSPSKLQIGPQQAVVGGGASKSGGGTNKAIHAILIFSLTKVFQLLATPSCPRRSHPQLSHLQLFLDFSFCQVPFSLFLVCFSSLFPI